MAPRSCAAIALVTALVVIAGCGAGGGDKEASVACEGSQCTVTYPAKARNNQASSGYGPAEVFGVQTQLFGISGGQATFRIDGQEAILQPGKPKKVGSLSVVAVELTDTSATIKYTKS